MKKLIIVVAIFCVAAVSHAASVMWQATAASGYSGKNLYLLTSIASTYESFEKFETSAVDVGSVKKIAVTYQVPQRTAENAAITKASNFYLAVVDDNTIHYLDVTGTFRPMVYDGSDNSPGTATAAFADVANSTTTATIGGSPEPVPEPTSGILLLFGVAGLALRRRRA